MFVSRSTTNLHVNVLVFNVILLAVIFVEGRRCKLCHLQKQRENRIRSVRGQILTKLELTSPPFVKVKVNVSEDVMETYKTVVEESTREESILQSYEYSGARSYFAQTVAKLPLERELGKVTLLIDTKARRRKPADVFLLKFNTSEIDEKSHITRAELRLNTNWLPTLPRSGSQIDICPNSVPFKSSHFNRSHGQLCSNTIGSSFVSANEKAWIAFDITSSVQCWVNELNSNMGLRVIIHNLDDSDKESAVPIPEGYGVPRKTIYAPTHTTPHILAWYIPVRRSEEEKRRRRKRALDMRFCRKRPKEKRCCLRSLYIDFQRDLKWKWIHAPPGFQANFCGGKCPFLWGLQNQTHHTSIMALLNSVNPDAPGEPCCVANAYKPLVILYYEQGRPKIEELSNMVVSECTCL